MPDPLKHGELMERLRRRVLGAEGQGARAFLFEEVNVGERRVDGLEVGIWSSHGQLIRGYEAKASRRDWLNEIKDPSKSQPLFDLCNEFWLVTNPGVLMPGELPPDWGLLISNGKRRLLKVEKPAVQKDGSPIDYSLMTSLLRSAMRAGKEDAWDIRKELQDEFDEKKKELNRLAGHDVDALERERDRAVEKRDELTEKERLFCEATGINQWNFKPEVAKMVGEVYAAINGGGYRLDSLHDQLGHTANLLSESAEKMASAQQLIRRRI